MAVYAASISENALIEFSCFFVAGFQLSGDCLVKNHERSHHGRYGSWFLLALQSVSTLNDIWKRNPLSVENFKLTNNVKCNGNRTEC